MKENKIVITINKPISEVFEFTINPKNTPLWISDIKEELSDNYPPKINTIYKNRRISGQWNYYKVIELENNKIFTLKSLDGDYFVKYIYKKISETKTELEYIEYVERGEIEKPFTLGVLKKLKDVIENSI
jgi:uncharacterized membrane protein